MICICCVCVILVIFLVFSNLLMWLRFICRIEVVWVLIMWVNLCLVYRCFFVVIGIEVNCVILVILVGFFGGIGFLN